jgi:small GTP-binding protein
MPRQKTDDIAEQKIAFAFRSRATKLDLSGNQLKALPESLGQLTQLRSLDLSGNELTALPESLGQLTQLQSLDLSGNQLTALPESLGRLTQLWSLYLFGNQLTALPESLGRLTQLLSLYLFSNQLTALPESLGQLKQLQMLVLSNNNLTALPESLGRLTQLRSLDLSGNGLTVLPESLGQLKQLQMLVLSNNKLTALLESLCHLTQLESLFLHGNPGLGIPESVLGPAIQEVYGTVSKDRKQPARPEDILNFYLSRRGAMATLREVGEVKMMLVGRGGAGKTSLRRYFLGQPHNREEKETPGIALDTFTLRCKQQEVLVRLWDFAGQEITHALHQFFLTEGCVYVLVLDPRSNTEMRDAEYWLELLKRYAGGAPVVMALNRQDARQGGYEVDRRGLQERFPFVREFVPTNCQTRMGCEDLRRAVQTLIAGLKATELPHLKVPESWLNVMRECRGEDNSGSSERPGGFVHLLGRAGHASESALAKAKRQHMTLEEFRVICVNNGETDVSKQESLARLLHRLGVVLHFVDEPRLRDTAVLNPHWVTDGVYRLLRYKDRPNSDGILTLAEALEALPGETEQTVRFLLRLMERFEMCFPVEDDGKEPPEKWLVPGALTQFQPQGIVPDWQRPGSVRLRYVYDLLPEGVLPRFIVLTHPLSTGQPRWRNGVVVKEGNAASLVRRGEKANHVEVIAFGPAADRLRLLEIVQGNMDRINADLPDPKPVAELELAGLPGVYRSVADLEAAERAKQSVVVSAPPVEAKVEPTPQLNQTSEPATRDPTKVPLNAFLSYSHQDKRQKEIFQNNLTVLMKKKFITPWHDGLIEPGMKWLEEIEANLEKMDVFVGLLSTAFLASDFIDKVELKAARERLRERKRDFLFVLILLDDIPLAGLDLAEYQILKPGGKAVSEHASKKAGFDKAQAELEKLLAKRQQALKLGQNKEFGGLDRFTRRETLHEGVTIIVQGDFVAGDKPLMDSHDVVIDGNNYGQAGQRLTDCTNAIQQQVPGERKALLEELEREVRSLVTMLPDEKKEEAAGDFDQLIKGATAATPNRRWYSMSAHGLIEASEFLKTLTGNIVDTLAKPIERLGKLLWPDFSLPKPGEETTSERK